MKKRNQGFTLVEIMIVVAIIAILAAVAIPNFINYTKKTHATACIGNLSRIEEAKVKYFMEHAATATPALADLVGTDKDIKTLPECKAGGTYTVGGRDTDPSCSIGEGEGTDYKHVLHPATTTTP